ncbi:MAG: proteasome subunit beta [Halanaeroarchaeum sp.]
MNVRTESGRWPTDAVLRADGRGGGTGGTLVGLTTADGVLLAADSRTSRGTTVSGDVRKIEPVSTTAALGSTADLGTMQSLLRTVRFEASRHETDRGKAMSVPALGTVASEALRGESHPTATFVLGGVDGDGPHVFTIDPEGGLLEAPYLAAGTGRETAYGVLDAATTESLAEARRIAGDALATANERDALTGVEVRVAEITAHGVDVRRYESVDDLR